MTHHIHRLSIASLSASAAAITAATIASACGSSSPSTSTTPTTPAPTVASVSVTGVAPGIGASTQFVATATLSNGSTQTVTSQASWQSSNTAVATVTSSGVVTSVAAGDAEIAATYQNVRGGVRITIERPAARTFTLSGTVTDGFSAGVLPNITVQIDDGENAGKSARTDAAGAYAIPALSAGVMKVTASASSYQTTSQSVVVGADTRMDFVLSREAPVCVYQPGPEGQISRMGMVSPAPTVTTSLPTCRWTAMTSATWLYLKCDDGHYSPDCKYSGIGSGPVVVGANTNAGPGRRATLTVTFPGGQMTLSVAQAGCLTSPLPCYPVAR